MTADDPRANTMQLYVDIEGKRTAPALPGDGAAVVALLSFAAMRGFGAEHPLIALSERLQIEHHVPMGPLTTFYEGEVEDEEDARKLDMAWQDGRELLASIEGALTAMAEDERCSELVDMAGTPGLIDELRALASTVRPAVEGGARVRLSYAL